jgi:16S rRNA (guanine527-N7)-methyltransferase
MTDDDALVAALRAIQARGAIGEASIAGAITHAEQFVRMIPDTARTLVDLGSGGGLPGLVIAVRRPDLSITLVERRASRADLLRRAVVALDAGARVTVVADDVRVVAEYSPASFDTVTARSFAAPSITARWAGALLRPGGILVVSEPPDDDPARWPADVLDRHRLHDQGRDQGVRTFAKR